MAEVSGAEAAKRINLLYIAPWVDLGGSDRNTVDLLRWLDRDRRGCAQQRQDQRCEKYADATQHPSPPSTVDAGTLC